VADYRADRRARRSASGAARARDPRRQGASRLAATDLTRFDLDRPGARLTADTQTFSFGIINTVAREQYVLTGNTVYPVELRYGAALPAMSRRSSASTFCRRRGAGAFRVQRLLGQNADGKWTVTPAPADLSQDDINRWIDDWRLASALRVEPHGRARRWGKSRLNSKTAGSSRWHTAARTGTGAAASDQNLQYSFLRNRQAPALTARSEQNENLKINRR